MPAIIISSVAESAGKTTIAAALVSHLIDSGREVGAAIDAAGLFADDPLYSIVDANEVEATDESVAVIEGSTGDSVADLALAERIDARIVLVVRLDDDVAEAVDEYGDRLAGVIFNGVPRYRDTHLNRLVDVLGERDVRCYGCVPEDRRLAAHSLSAIVDHLDGEVIVEGAGLDDLIDNYLIGGLVLDWGPFYFRSAENTCVVVRGGRPDVQIAALQSETTRAVVMTGGERPIDYVFYEARTKGIPLIVVNDGTVEAMDRLDSISSSAFAHQSKLERIKELVNEESMISEVADLLAMPATR